jgi:ketosteroid isomerase-like protein
VIPDPVDKPAPLHREESTNPDLVELTRRAYDYASDRNWDALLSFYGADSVWDMSPLGLGTYEGPAAIRRFFEEWTGSYDKWEQELEEILDLGNGVVVSVLRQNARLPGSTGSISLLYAGVLVWREGLIARLTNYTDVDQARAAAERLAESRG